MDTKDSREAKQNKNSVCNVIMFIFHVNYICI